MTETLRAYLEGGGLLNAEVHHELIAAVAHPLSADERADRAAVVRYESETLADGGDPRPERHLVAEQRSELARAESFLADYLEADPDPELDRMIRAAVPESRKRLDVDP